MRIGARALRLNRIRRWEPAILASMRDGSRRLRWVPGGVLLLLIACAGAGPIRAEDPANSPAELAPPPEGAAEPAADPARPRPGLDSLLTLPGDRTYTVERRGGLTRGEWKAKFAEVHADLVAEHAALEDAERRMDEAADSGQWQVSPPIPGQQNANPGETTLDFKTRQEIRRNRAEIERLERRLQDLEIEANLAAVPDDWRS